MPAGAINKVGINGTLNGEGLNSMPNTPTTGRGAIHPRREIKAGRRAKQINMDLLLQSHHGHPTIQGDLLPMEAGRSPMPRRRNW